jgi:hypothetical protein
MGKVQHVVADKLIEAAPDRNANRLRVYRKENGEVVIHLRELKIVLFPHEVHEWAYGFTVARAKLVESGLMKNDL